MPGWQALPACSAKPATAAADSVGCHQAAVRRGSAFGHTLFIYHCLYMYICVASFEHASQYTVSPRSRYASMTCCCSCTCTITHMICTCANAKPFLSVNSCISCMHRCKGYMTDVLCHIIIAHVHDACAIVCLPTQHAKTHTDEDADSGLRNRIPRTCPQLLCLNHEITHTHTHTHVHTHTRARAQAHKSGLLCTCMRVESNRSPHICEHSQRSTERTHMNASIQKMCIDALVYIHVRRVL